MNSLKNLLNRYSLYILIVGLLIIRFINLSSPFFTSEEARIAYRGYSLGNKGTDELGRKYPIIFNSLEGYELPLPTYVEATGVFVFGKSDLGSRIPFIVIGMAIAIFTSKIARTFNGQDNFREISLIVVGFSPVLIYLSKVPNEFSLLTLLFLVLFYLLTRNKINLVLVILSMLAIALTSKFSWFILAPFTTLTVMIFQKLQTNTTKALIISLSIAISMLAILLFLQIPQAKRDLSENLFPIFSDVSIKNGIEKLRSQGLEAGWPSLAERSFFNKANYLVIGLMKWFSDLQLHTLFANFDKAGKLNYVGIGAFPKILIIPFILGLIRIAKRKELKCYSLILYILVLSFPLMFITKIPQYGFLVPTLPFISLIITIGLYKLSSMHKWIIFSFMALELIPTLLFLPPNVKNTNDIRPTWIIPVLRAVSQSNKPAISDDTIEDVAPFYMWFTTDQTHSTQDFVGFPYKYRQTTIGKLTIIGSNATLLSCTLAEQYDVFLSNRDLGKIPENTNSEMLKSYSDELNHKRVYTNIEKLCLKQD